tara:strand:- start:24888 stop:25658 length:771 start_codon:yes stop_codon:yes gene_type:complete
MQIQIPYNNTQLRKQYHKMALKHHPDKNGDSDSFIELQEAYLFLSLYDDTEEKEDVNEEINMDILQKIINIVTDIENIKNVTETLRLQINNFLKKYARLFNINENTLLKIKEIFTNLKSECITLNPCIENMMNADIHVLEYDNETYCVPLWHNELTYNIGNKLLIIQCIPQLPNHMNIDTYGNIIVNIITSIKKVLEYGFIEINIGKKTHVINGNKLKIINYQSITFKKIGIPCIDSKNIYDISNKCDIIINLTLF